MKERKEVNGVLGWLCLDMTGDEIEIIVMTAGLAFT